MDRTFQDKIEHETKQLKKRGLARQFHFTNLKLSEKILTFPQMRANMIIEKECYR